MTNNFLKAPRRLEKTDDTSDFSCGVDSLDNWFQKFAWQNQQANNAVVYVSTLNDEVVGYFAIASGSVAHGETDRYFERGRPDPVPVIILARLAVAEKAQGRCVGRSLFKDALGRALSTSELVGAAAMVIHAADDKAKDFYLRYADFQEFPGEPLHLLLPTKTLKRIVNI